MRELKFRAFDTENKTWTFVTLGDLICGACTENGDKPLSGAKQVWEQYTGLKDKNGKPIYEGDIVKFNETICIVEFDEMYARYTLRDLSDDVVIGFDALIISPFGVIGNIHENGDLLEEEE